MKLVLLSTYESPISLGVRYISAFLKRAGHDVTCLFLSKRYPDPDSMSAALVGDFVDHCRGADLVGLSLMTNSFFISCRLTEALRQSGIKSPVVWGGTHATVAPRESAEVADYVCIGEGEKALAEFIDAMEAGRDPSQTRGFAFLRDGQLVTNPIYPLADDLDTYPFPDYTLDDHWIAGSDKFVSARSIRLGGALRRYRMSSTRGCPFSCAFCNNSTQFNIYRQAGYGRHWVRKRSAESVIAEIEQVRSLHPSIKGVNLIDDLFLVRSEDELETFVRAYVQRVNLPLDIDTFPNTITQAKIELLSHLPIALITMGIQSGCQDTLRNIYNRPTRVETIANAIRIISSYGLQAEYHYLVNNPFESDENRIETLRFAASHHRGPARLRIFPLQFFPGSVLYQRAREAGVIGERPDEAYRGVYAGKKYIARSHYPEIWLRVVLSLRGAGVSSRLLHRLISVVIHPFVRKRLDKPWFAPLALTIYTWGRAIYKNLLYKPFIKPIKLLRFRRRKPRDRAVAQKPAPASKAT